jgi:hypothetical protein
VTADDDSTIAETPDADLTLLKRRADDPWQAPVAPRRDGRSPPMFRRILAAVAGSATSSRGLHGRRGLAHVVMGSDAEGVVHASAVPVRLVHLRTALVPAQRKASARRSTNS